MTAKELRERLERFGDEELHIRIAAYSDAEDCIIHALAEMDSLYLSKEGDRVNLDFLGKVKATRRWF